MGNRRVTWRVSHANFDWLYRYMKRKGLKSMNDALNLKLSDIRESEEYSAVKLLSDSCPTPKTPA